MTPILLLCIRLAFVSQPPWEELSLSISQEIGISSDTVTLCRVRVVNHGARVWPGREIRFVAEALEGGRIVESARGRFGLSLAPHETLETLIGFSGSYRHFQVRPAEKGTDRSDARRHGAKGKRKKGKKKR
jgi:hypothetical protein